jgi:hypothetical protein
VYELIKSLKSEEEEECKGQQQMGDGNKQQTPDDKDW